MNQNNEYWGNRLYFQNATVFSQPERRELQGGNVVTKFTIVESQGKNKDGTYKPGWFVDVQAWGDLAEQCALLNKKDRVYLCGRVRLDSWIGQDGKPRSKPILSLQEVSINQR